MPGVDDVLHHENVLPLDGEVELPGDLRPPVRFGPVPVAGDLDEVEHQGKVDVPDQIDGEDDGAAQNGDDEEIPVPRSPG